MIPPDYVNNFFIKETGYELYKQLKDAGFPQGFSSAYSGRFDCGCLEGRDVETDILLAQTECGREYVYIPTLPELIEACGDVITTLEFQSNVITAKGVISHGNRRYSDQPYTLEDLIPDDYLCTVGETPEEAVALLYIKLHENDKKN